MSGTLLGGGRIDVAAGQIPTAAVRLTVIEDI